MTDEEAEAMFDRIKKAREAIVAILLPWRRGSPDARGEIECPLCKGRLAFMRAGCNGHIHARCDGDDCVSWME